MFLLSILLLVLMAGGASTSSNPSSETTYHDVDDPQATDIASMEEIVFKDINMMSIKQTIHAKPGTQELPVRIYSHGYKLAKKIVQRQTRIASVIAVWTPTSDDCGAGATLFIMDDRYQNEGLVNRGSWLDNLKGKGKSQSISGRIIDAVAFNPSQQVLIFGGVNIATATSDIDKIRFYLKVDCGMKNSVPGFLDLTWKTLPDAHGVYEKKRWEVFTFPTKRMPENVAHAGKTQFEILKKQLNLAHGRQVANMKLIDEYHNNIAYIQDQGLNIQKKKINELATDLNSLLSNSDNKLKAIELQKVKDELEKASEKYNKAMLGTDPAAIQEMTDTVSALLVKYNLLTGVEKSDDSPSEVGQIKINKVGRASD